MMRIPEPQPNDGFVWTQEPWGRTLRSVHLPVPHLFTSRDVRLRDDPHEWELVARSLGIPRDRLLLIKQVHGAAVAVWRGDRPREEELPPQGGSYRILAVADVVITNDPTVAIGVRTADCAPVLLYDRARNVAAAAHAGWRGAAADVAGTAVRALQREFGSAPRDLLAAVGPCLGACCGEVGPEVVEAFRRGFGAAAAGWFSPGTGDRSYLDLERANRDQLARAGVDPVAIFASGLCTKTHHEHFHSYRAEGAATGRLLAAIRVSRSALRS